MVTSTETPRSSRPPKTPTLHRIRRHRSRRPVNVSPTYKLLIRKLEFSSTESEEDPVIAK